jgi:large subunit ribosomal protein L17
LPRRGEAGSGRQLAAAAAAPAFAAQPLPTMKHRVSMRKLGRDSAHRRALLRNQVTSLIEHERIETTVAKAKELRRAADKMINFGKLGTPSARRAIEAYLLTQDTVRKLIHEVGPRFVDRPGGYVRVLKTRNRRGDCAPMAVVELSETENSILTPEQLRAKEARKSKYRRGLSPPSLANALPDAAGDVPLERLDPSGKLR